MNGVFSASGSMPREVEIFCGDLTFRFLFVVFHVSNACFSPLLFGSKALCIGVIFRSYSQCLRDFSLDGIDLQNLDEERDTDRW